LSVTNWQEGKEAVNRMDMYDFFVVNDSARWRAYRRSLLLALPLALILFVAGVDGGISAIIGGVTGIAVFMFAAGIHSSPAPEQRAFFAGPTPHLHKPIRGR
jgi:hypothetical protein